MSITVYRDTNYQGPFAQIRPGFYSGRDIRGFRNQSAYGSGEDLDNAISSIRVGPNTIVALYGGLSPSASSGARVIVGPFDVPDLSALGINDMASAIQVLSFKGYNSGIPRTGGAILYSGYEGQGKYSVLEQGDYDAARLASEEVKFPNSSLRSIRVSANVIAILYTGPAFETSMDAVVVVGPTMIGDLDRIGLLDRVSSVRIMYTDPYDTAARPSTALGTTRAYFPGGDAGYTGSRRIILPTPPAGRQSSPQISAPVGPPSVLVQGALSGHKERQKMWIVIFVLFVLLIVMGAYVVSVTRAAKKISGMSLSNFGPPTMSGM